MEIKEKDFCIDERIIKNYVAAINSLTTPMNIIKEQLNQKSKKLSTVGSISEMTKELKKSIQPTIDQLDSISIMSNILKEYLKKHPKEKSKVLTNTIKQLMNVNNGMLSTRMIEPLNISRQYISIMENNKEIEKVARGIYLLPKAFEDSYFAFQQKYKKAIFSHMHALYFHGMTEEFPYDYTVTVPQRYHVDFVNKKCNVFYVSDDIYELGLIEIETPNGNKARVYDKERCICDVIRSKGRMDFEQVKKAIRQYIESKDKDMSKLSEYSKKMGINKKVMEMVGEAYY